MTTEAQPRPTKKKASHDLTWIDERGVLQVDLHAGQWRALNSRARHVLVLAGTQSGKTSFGPLWLLMEIQRRGPGDYLIVTPSFVLLELKLRPEFMKLFDKQMRLGAYVGSPIRRFVFSDSGGERLFGDRHDPDVTTSIYFAHAQDPESVESATVKAAWLDEAGQKKFKLETHEAIERRVSLHQGRVLYTTTPYYLGWLKKKLHDKADGVRVEVVNFSSLMNPAFSRAEFAEQKAKLPKWKFDMMYRGKFTKPAGLIYDVYSWERHTCDPFDIPPHWQTRVIGIDFGAVNTAALKFAQCPTCGKWYGYAQYHAGGRIAREHAAQLLAGEPNAWAIQAVGGAPSEQDKRDELSAIGLQVDRPPVSDVEVGIMRLYALLKLNQIKFFRTLSSVVGGEDDEGREVDGEIERYSRVLDEHGEPTDKISDKSKFHHLDAARYAATVMKDDDLLLMPVTLSGRR